MPEAGRALRKAAKRQGSKRMEVETGSTGREFALGVSPDPPTLGIAMSANHYTNIAPDAGALVATVIRRLENPALSKSALSTVPVMDGEWIQSAPAKREKPRRVVMRDGTPKNRHGGAWARLSPEDREDVGQAVAMVIARHGFFSPGGWVIGEIPRPVWIEFFAEARAACRIDRKHERGALRFSAMATADFVALVDSRAEERYLTRDRAAIARRARFYLWACKAARDAQKAAGNRKWASNYATARAFLRASIGHSLHGAGWGDFFPDMPEDAKAAENFRDNAKRVFRAYVRAGIATCDAPQVLRGLEELNAFLFDELPA